MPWPLSGSNLAARRRPDDRRRVLLTCSACTVRQSTAGWPKRGASTTDEKGDQVFEVEVPDAGWLNGPTQLLVMAEFRRESDRLMQLSAGVAQAVTAAGGQLVKAEPAEQE